MHFTYADRPDSTQLYQGDLIARTDAVDSILAEVHPHYRKEDYRAFIILTQTCDLVRRNGEPCAARYISIAAVRPLDLVLKRKFAEVCRAKWEAEYRLTSRKNREKLRLFLARLLNNNEDEYFYLRRDAPGGLTEDCCAFLQLSIAVKAELHYSTLLEAKKLQLEDTFQHKLGYLVGKMYSRVGTPDWVPTALQHESQFDDLINGMIDSNDFAMWVEDDEYRTLLKKVRESGDGAVTKDLLLQWAKEFRTAKAARRREVLDAIENALREVGVSEPASKRALGRINNTPAFSSMFKN